MTEIDPYTHQNLPSSGFNPLTPDEAFKIAYGPDEQITISSQWLNQMEDVIIRAIKRNSQRYNSPYLQTKLEGKLELIESIRENHSINETIKK